MAKKDNYAHEMSRIRQFKNKAKDDEHFKRMLIIRASRCSQEKLDRFCSALRQCGHIDLAGFIKGMYTS